MPEPKNENETGQINLYIYKSDNAVEKKWVAWKGQNGNTSKIGSSIEISTQSQMRRAVQCLT